MKRKLTLVCIPLASIMLTSCGGFGQRTIMNKEYFYLDTSPNLGVNFASGMGGGYMYTKATYTDTIGSSGASISSLGVFRTLINNGVLGDLPTNNNLNGGSLDFANISLQRENGNYIGRCGGLGGDGTFADGFLYEWSDPNQKPTNIPTPTYRTTRRNTDGNWRLEGAIPLALTKSDWLLVNNSYSYPTSLYRIKLGTDQIESIGDPYESDMRGFPRGYTLLGEGGQVVVGTFNEARYYSTPTKYELIPGSPGIFFRAITPAGIVVGNSFSATDLTNRGYWYWVPGGTVQEIKLAGKRDVQVIGCSVDGTIVGYYFDEVLNREVAWVLTELGKQPTPLEDLIPGDEKIYRANAINWDGFILGLRRDASNNPVSILIKPTP